MTLISQVVSEQFSLGDAGIKNRKTSKYIDSNGVEHKIAIDLQAENVAHDTVMPHSKKRSVEARGNERISLGDFDIKKDGSANDPAVISQVLAACAGKTVFIPAGDYLFDTDDTQNKNVFLPSNTHIVGEAGSSVFRFTNEHRAMTNANRNNQQMISGGSVFTLSPLNHNIQIENLTIRGNADGQNVGYNWEAMANPCHFENVQDVFISNCNFQNAKNDGLTFEYANRINIKDSVFSGCRKAGLYFSGVRHAKVIGNTMRDNKSDGQVAGIGVGGVGFIGVAYDSLFSSNLLFNNNWQEFVIEESIGLNINGNDFGYSDLSDPFNPGVMNGGNVVFRAEARGGQLKHGNRDIIFTGNRVKGYHSVELGSGYLISNNKYSFLRKNVPYEYILDIKGSPEFDGLVDADELSKIHGNYFLTDIDGNTTGGADRTGGIRVRDYADQGQNPRNSPRFIISDNSFKFTADKPSKDLRAIFIDVAAGLNLVKHNSAEYLVAGGNTQPDYSYEQVLYGGQMRHLFADNAVLKSQQFYQYQVGSGNF